MARHVGRDVYPRTLRMDGYVKARSPTPPVVLLEQLPNLDPHVTDRLARYLISYSKVAAGWAHYRSAQWVLQVSARS